MIGVGLAIGLAAGISPGPLMVLVVTQTLRSGRRAGVLTAAAPLLTDAVVILGVILVLNALPERALPIMGVVGGAYVIWTGVETWRESRHGRMATADAPGSSWRALWRAGVINLLSPHPWLTWATALGPLTLSAWHRAPAAGAALVLGFYISLIGAKAVVAVLVAGGRGRLTDAGYRRALQAGAVLLAVAGLVLVAEFLPAAIRG